MDEIDRLKQLQSQHGSTSSWSDVGESQQLVLVVSRLNRLEQFWMGIMSVGDTTLLEVLKRL